MAPNKTSSSSQYSPSHSRYGNRTSRLSLDDDFLPPAKEAPARKRVEARSGGPKRTPVPRPKRSSSRLSKDKGDPSFGKKGSRRSGGSDYREPSGGRRRQKKGGDAPLGAPPKKRGKARIIVLAIIIALALFYGIDTVTQIGKIHRGVTVGDVKVGGMTAEEAASAIDGVYGASIGAGNLTMYADEAAKASSEESTVISFDYESLESYNENPPEGPVFEVSPATLGATLDSKELANEAYRVGRGGDFVLGRIKANTVGARIDLRVDMPDESLDALSDILTNSLGKMMVNPGIRYEDGAFVTTPGNDGYMVETDELTDLIEEALLSENRSFVIPMGERKMEVEDRAAEQAAEEAQAAIAEPITLVYGDRSWSLDADILGPLVSTYVDKRSLVPYVSLPKIEEAIPGLEGMGDIGQPARDVRFSYDGETLQHVDAQNGTSPDYEFITNRINKIAFGNEMLSENAGESSSEILEEDGETVDTTVDDEMRRVTMTLTTSYPKLTFADAQKLGITDSMIASYTTEFDPSSENKATNIKLLADLLTSTVIAPGETFSINDTAGECNEEKGFQEAGSILNGGITSEIGGGICQVATTIFNATFEAGFPIVERHNHSNYMASYPDGLDAAISWPYMDFRFKNDTDNYILLLVDYTDSTLTCSIWGIDPGYTVEYETVDWQEGEEAIEREEKSDEHPEGYTEVKSRGKPGHSVVVERKVYDAKGNLHLEDSIESIYQPSATITIVGTASDDEEE